MSVVALFTVLPTTSAFISTTTSLQSNKCGVTLLPTNTICSNAQPELHKYLEKVCHATAERSTQKSTPPFL